MLYDCFRTCSLVARLLGIIIFDFTSTVAFDVTLFTAVIFLIADTNSVSGRVMKSMAASSLTVKWDAPAGERTSYIVTLDDGSGSEETKTPDQDTTSAKFTGLTAGKSYTVRLVTASGSAKFYTRKCNGCFKGCAQTPHGKNPSKPANFFEMMYCHVEAGRNVAIISRCAEM